MFRDSSPLLSKAKFIALVVYGTVAWYSRRSQSCDLKSSIMRQHFELGLKALTSSSQEKSYLKVPCCIISRNILPASSSSFTASTTGGTTETDYAPECDDKREEEKQEDGEEEEKEKEEKAEAYYHRHHQQQYGRREFPPPIPLLARTENLQGRMPFVFKRYRTDDGRLIITKEKVKHYEYFRAHRTNGRLILQLIPLDDDGDCGHDDVVTVPHTTTVKDNCLNDDIELDLDSETEKTEKVAAQVAEADEEENEDVVDVHDNGGEEEKPQQQQQQQLHDEGAGITEYLQKAVLKESRMMILASSMPEVTTSVEIGSGACREFFAYCNSWRRVSNSDTFRMPIPTIRAVHT